MICYSEAMPVSVKSHIMGGTGEYLSKEIFTKEQMEGRARLFSVNTLPQGCSIGVHTHTAEAEAYLILQGEATVTEDGKDYLLHASDAEFCAAGHSHGIANHAPQELVFLAVIMVDP